MVAVTDHCPAGPAGLAGLAGPAALAANAEPLPVLLVLQPTMVGPPWDELVARAAATLQEPQFSRVLPEASTRATLELAIARLPVRHVVIGGEGPGSPLGAAPLGVRTRAIATAVAALPLGRRRRPSVDALWFDSDARRWLAYELDASTGSLTRLCDPMSLLGLDPTSAALDRCDLGHPCR